MPEFVRSASFWPESPLLSRGCIIVPLVNLEKRVLKNYFITQRKWLYDINKRKNSFECSVNSLLDNKKSDFCINVQRFDKFPVDSKSTDVQRCRDTKQRLENAILKRNLIKKELENNIPHLLNSQGQSHPWALDEHQFCLKKISELQSLCNRLQVCANNVSHTEIQLKRKFPIPSTSYKTSTKKKQTQQ